MRRGRRAWLTLTILTCAPLLVAVASSSAQQTSAPIPWGGTSIVPLPVPRGILSEPSQPSNGPTTVLLSNERTFTQWATVARDYRIFQSPDAHSKAVGHLHDYTEDGLPEVYLLLRATWDSGGQEWVRLRIPMRPNGRTGWVRREALDSFHLTNLLIVVDRRQMQMQLYNNGKLLWHAPVGVGKPSTPTPAGHFWIREGFKISDRSSGYWPYAFGTSDYSTLTEWPGGGVVGIHGPYHQPQYIPGRPGRIGVLRISSPKVMPMARTAKKRDMSMTASNRPPSIAKNNAVAEMNSVICNPDIRKSRLFGMMSQRNW